MTGNSLDTLNELILGRWFQVWAYTVGHRQLLLRSTKSVGVDTRIDLLFKNVSAIKLQTTMTGVQLEALTEGLDEAVALLEFDLENQTAYQITCSSFKGWVVAGSAAWHVDECEYDAPSHFVHTLGIAGE